ncbi:hypothetical protein E1288_19145 [Saccharopolyspora elongata]|uniref:LysR substrate-binding domain-containing protein n=1 Tax=Saccharopolyspora elongata TaxID=2530387 RepID=A0A4R4YW12_9PSEU|nr:hypothetical protein E1288_19145 [Saccharopolyspora elongata]
MLALAASRPLADAESVSYEDLGDQTVVDAVVPAYWREVVIPSHTPSGRPIKIGPHVNDLLELIPVLASGEAVSPVHAQTARYFARPDIAFVPIRDAALAHWALVWRTASQTDLIRDFAQIVEEHGPLAL